MTENLQLAERMVLRSVPAMPETTTARRLAGQLPYSRTTIEKALRRLASSHIMALEGSQGRVYTRYIEGSLL